MTTIGAFEAKTHFSQIIEKVEQGQDYVVTKRGKPAAKIVPVAERTESRAEGIRQLAEYRKFWKGDEPFNIREAIEEGRP